MDSNHLGPRPQILAPPAPLSRSDGGRVGPLRVELSAWRSLVAIPLRGDSGPKCRKPDDPCSGCRVEFKTEAGAWRSMGTELHCSTSIRMLRSPSSSRAGCGDDLFSGAGARLRSGFRALRVPGASKAHQRWRRPYDLNATPRGATSISNRAQRLAGSVSV
jgi:hypothetical protein